MINPFYPSINLVSELTKNSILDIFSMARKYDVMIRINWVKEMECYDICVKKGRYAITRSVYQYQLDNAMNDVILVENELQFMINKVVKESEKENDK